MDLEKTTYEVKHHERRAFRRHLKSILTRRQYDALANIDADNPEGYEYLSDKDFRACDIPSATVAKIGFPYGKTNSLSESHWLKDTDISESLVYYHIGHVDLTRMRSGHLPEDIVMAPATPPTSPLRHRRSVG